LGPEYPFYGLQAAGIDDDYAPHIRVEQMAAHYLEQIRQAQSCGPYFIGGWSFGGWIAFEIARRLHEAGETVGLLAFLDSAAPHSVRLGGLADFVRLKYRTILKRVRTHGDRWLEQDLRGKLRYVADVLGRRLDDVFAEVRHISRESAGAA